MKTKKIMSNSKMVHTKESELFTVSLPEHGEDVTGARSIFASIDASTKLTQWLQDVHIVTAHKVLGQVHYGHHESLLQGQMRNGRLVVVKSIENHCNNTSAHKSRLLLELLSVHCVTSHRVDCTSP